MKKYWRDGNILLEWKVNALTDNIIIEKRPERNESELCSCSLIGATVKYSFLLSESDNSYEDCLA